MVKNYSYTMSKETVGKLLGLAQQGELNKGDRINFILSDSVVNEIVSDVGLDYFETMRFAVAGRPIAMIPEFLHSVHGSELKVTHVSGSQPYHSLLEKVTGAQTKHA